MIGMNVGTYKITEKIGEGGMGSVYKGVDLMLEREVAIKVLRPELAVQPEVVERFRAEAVTLAKLNHPKIATLYSFFRHRDNFLMVMEFVPGETLGDVICREGAMSCERAIQLFCQALDGIEHAHTLGIIHRDIKPGNMMLTPTAVVKVMDFGIARVLGTARMTRQGNLIGTIEYMSPEQVRGGDTDARSDIYSAGIVLYELLTGRVPFASDSDFELMRAQIEDYPPTFREFSTAIPESVEQAVFRALQKTPEDRYETAGDFRDALMEACLETGLMAPRNAHLRSGVYDSRNREIRTTGNTPKDTVPVPGEELPAPPAEVEIKATRLAPSSGNFEAPTTPNSIMPYVTVDQPSPERSVPSSSGFLNSLGWKHYLGAGLFVLVITFVTFTLVAAISSLALTGSQITPASTTAESPAKTVNETKEAPKTSTPEAEPPPPPNSVANFGIDLTEKTEKRDTSSNKRATTRKAPAKKPAATDSKKQRALRALDK